MAGINLLPWRELKRERARQKVIVLMLSMFFLLALGEVFFRVYLQSLVEKKQQNHEVLERKLQASVKASKEIERLKERERLLLSELITIKNIKKLQQHLLRLLEEISKIIPEEVTLINLKRIQNKIVITGFYLSNTALLQLLKNIEKNQWMREPALVEIKNANRSFKQDKEIFKISFNFVVPEAAEKS